MDKPCLTCDVGWESISSAGSMSCRDKCERLKAWEAKKKVDKPRICEVLGVEVGEPFGFNDFPFDEPKEFMVNENGEIRPNGDGCITPSEICYIINNADCILHKPRFTQQEVERAKAIKVIWPNADRIQGSCGSFGVGIYYVWFSSDLLGQINDDDCFPSIGSGETVTLDEIIGGAQ